ncbi:BSD domain-containing protein [Forsythia ovata]|uniref:BSD domain-containing protein n=1 Tax=Forsythia ovata TaxID=205694 RepID=A0ABD1UCD1_9LAMI
MSWLARSIANTLKLDDDDDDSEVNKSEPEPGNLQLQDNDAASPTSPSCGVKEDFSELTKTLTRQLRGVVSFLAPPPQQSQPDPDSDIKSVENLDGIAGIRSNFVEIGGKFKNGITRLSNNINVSEITKMASNLLQLESDEEEEGTRDSSRKGAVGVTEEVVSFAGDIAMHPETWLDFPLPESDDDDFDMSYVQQEHALAVERLAPRLAAVRNELCPGYISESYFWKIYFVLLHPRLDKQDVERLSTPQIVKARALLAQELKNLTATELEEEKGSLAPKDVAVPHHKESLFVPFTVLSENEPGKASVLELGTSTTAAASETVKHPVESNEIPVVDKSVIKQEDINRAKDQNTNDSGEKDEDDGDDWLKEECSETGSASGTTIPVENDDEVSFSDLEDNDGDMPASFRKANDSSDKDSQDWVQLTKISSDSSKDGEIKHSSDKNVNDHDTKESNDWLDVNDIDVV